MPIDFRLPEDVIALANYFDGRGLRAFIFGGAVRDLHLGRSIEDIDIAVNADARIVGREVADRFEGRCVLLHQEWPTVRVMLGAQSDLAHIDISTMEDTIERHLSQRDFTVNSMAVPLDRCLEFGPEMLLLDPCGGLSDLGNRLLRRISDEALDEDPVRLVRGARLAAQLSLSVEPQTARAIRHRASMIAGVPQERVRDELMRLLQLPNARAGVRLLDDLHLLCQVVPELAEAKGVEQPREHYWDVFDHQVEAVGWVDAIFGEAGEDNPPLDLVPRFETMDEYFSETISDGFNRISFLKLAALLHDVAKPSTKTTEDSGRIRFIGHHTEGAEVARSILTRLRFGRRGVEHVAALVRHHLRPRLMAQKGEMPSARALYRYYRDVGDVALDNLYLNTADYLAARGPLIEGSDWTEHCNLIRFILKDVHPQKSGVGSQSVKSLPKLVGGYDIMDRFVLSPGPVVGRLLEEVREAQASGEVWTREQAMDLVRNSLERGGDGA